MESLTAVIRGHVRSSPDRVALIFVDDPERADGARRWSFAQLDAEARKIGRWLQSRLSAGDRVLLAYPAGLDFVAAYVGCLYAGMIAVPAPLPGGYRHEQERLRGIARDAAISAVLTDTADLAVVTAWAAADIAVQATDDLPDAANWMPAELGHDTIAMLQYTSGSTGEPKGVMISHGNLLHNAETQRRAFGLTADTRVGGWIPHYHDMGLHGHLLPMLVIGGSCVLMRSSAFLKRPHQWLATIDRYDIHVSAAPNFAYELCCARVTDDQLAGLDLSRWRIAVSGSEPIDAAVLDAFAKRLAPAGFRDDVLCPCYGMAEATLFVSGEAHRKPVVTKVDVHRLRSNRFVPAAAGADLVSCGTPHDYDVVIADPLTGEPVAPGVIGEIWLRGPSISPGYWRNEIRAGCLRTGDLGALHDGELYVTGRLAEVMTVDGRHLYPQDVERQLRSRHAELVGGGAVFTVDDALIVTHEVGARLTEAARRRLAHEIGQTVAEEFGVSVGGVVLLRRGELRRTTSGKIQRVAMRRLFLAGALTLG